MKKILYPILILIIFLSITTYNNKEKEQLEKIINYEIHNSEKYTPNSYENYLNALNIAIDTKNKIFVSKKEINDAINNLENKIDNLDIKPSKELLKKTYKNASTIELNLYIPNSTTNLKNAINNAYNIINNDNATKQDVDEAINQINNAKTLLIEKPDKTNLETLINNTNNYDENKYTTESFNELKKSIDKANLILNNDNATKQDVDNAIQLINTSINNLIIATKGIYQINIYTYMISNNHVGNEWYSYTTYNGKDFISGNKITSKTNSKITINTTIVEDDKIPDSSTTYTELTLKDNFEITKKVTIRENRGRYYGNIAEWEIKYSVKLIKTLN